MNSGISKGAVVRTVVLIVALINQSLCACGHSILPVDEEQTEQLVSALWTTAAALAAWRKDNSFTRKDGKTDNEKETEDEKTL